MIVTSGRSKTWAPGAPGSSGRHMVRWAFGIAFFFMAAIGLPGPSPGAAQGQGPPGKPPLASEGAEVRLPPDLTFGTAGALPAVVFRHATHTAFTRGQCTACHPQPFKILHPTGRTNHAEMNAGRSCGACHNGRMAFATAAADACQRCHAGAAPPAPPVSKVPAGPPPARKVPRARAAAAPAAPPPAAVPGDVTFRKGAASPATVTFRHAVHGSVGCDRCHPGPFAMKAEGTPLDKAAMMQGKTCGGCHDGKQAFGVADAAGCARCHAAGGAVR